MKRAGTAKRLRLFRESKGPRSPAVTYWMPDIGPRAKFVYVLTLIRGFAPFARPSKRPIWLSDHDSVFAGNRAATATRLEESRPPLRRNRYGSDPCPTGIPPLEKRDFPERVECVLGALGNG